MIGILFSPSLIFIDPAEWAIEGIRDACLTYLFDYLDMVEKLKVV